MNRAILAFACMSIASCTTNEDERRSMLESNGRVNYEVAGRPIVRDLRAAGDSDRVIYRSPVRLMRPSASDSGARQVWAPFGIGKPDTVSQQPP
jgi:hypothetical protein